MEQMGWGSALSELARPFVAKRNEKKANEELAKAMGKQGDLDRYEQAMSEYQAGIAAAQKQIDEAASYERKKQVDQKYAPPAEEADKIQMLKYVQALPPEQQAQAAQMLGLAERPEKPVGPPAGYRATPEGNLEPIPGGEADYRRQQDKIKADKPVAPLSAADAASYESKLLDVNDALSILDKAESAINERRGQEGDSMATKVGKMFTPDTGPIDQYFPGQWGQSFNTMADQLFAVAKRVYKTPGEGNFTDKDAEALRGMLFDSGKYSDVNLKQINDLRSMLTDRQSQFKSMIGKDGAGKAKVGRFTIVEEN
jgi:hypothetical protein